MHLAHFEPIKICTHITACELIVAVRDRKRYNYIIERQTQREINLLGCRVGAGKGGRKKVLIKTHFK